MNVINEIQKLEMLENTINESLKKSNVSIKITGNENKGTIIISKDKKTSRYFEFEVVAYNQINIIENKKVIVRGLFTDYLGKWIYNLYNPVEYLYAFYGKKLNGKVLTREQIDKISTGLTKDYSKERAKGSSVHIKELDNQPIVDEYLGPIFEKIDYGKIYLRYETQEIYDMLSA